MRDLLTRSIRATLLLGLAGCGSQQHSRQDELEAPRPSEGMVEVNGVSLHYLDWGGEGELLLFVPGLGGTAYLWNGVAPHFTDRYRVIALTPREHGASEKPGPPFSIQAFADDLGEVIEQFSEGPAIVVGHSFAGATMIELARRRPSGVAALVFLDALYDFSANVEPPPAFPGGQPPPVFPSIDAAVQWHLDLFPDLVPQLVEPLVRSELSEDEDGLFRWALSPSYSARLTGLLMAAPLGELDGFSMPVLAVRVNQATAMTAGLAARGFSPDSIALGRRFAEEWDNVWKASAVNRVVGAIPGAKAVVLDSVSHMLPVERPDLVVQLLEDFLRSMTSPRH